ncbi:perforin-1-like [Rhinophrynus dorsalis]
MKASFVPGHTLLGEGVNIVTMKKTSAFLLNMQSFMKGNKTCTLCNNPFNKNVLQKLPTGMVDWRPQSSCSRKVSSSVSESKVSMADESSSSVDNDWKVGLSVEYNSVKGSTAMAGSHSDMTKFAESKTLTDKYNFLSHHLTCTYYSFRLSDSPPLASHFRNSLKNLPTHYGEKTKDNYKQLIEKYGTHYIAKAQVGGRALDVTAIRTCQVAMDGLTEDEVKDCLTVEAEVAAGIPENSASIHSKVNNCNSRSKKANRGGSFHQTFNERIWQVTGGKATFDLLSPQSNTSKDSTAFADWMESLKKDPDVVTYSLEPIHNLVKFSESIKSNLGLAVSEYIKERALVMNCSCPEYAHLSQRRDCSCICPPTKHMNSDCCPTSRGMARLTVKIKSAESLKDDYFSKTDVYVKFSFDNNRIQTETVWNTNYPTWNKEFEMGIVELSASKKYSIEVWDEDNRYDDDLLGRCEKTLTSGFKEEICYLNHGSVTYSMNVICATHLQGTYCQDYSPVPPP